jgi:hypothetical protein
MSVKKKVEWLEDNEARTLIAKRNPRLFLPHGTR